MLKELLKNPGALFFAVLVHVALIAILVVSIQWNSKPAALPGNAEIVKATVIDESKLQAEKQRKLDAEQAKRQAEEQRRQAELDRQRAEAQRQRDAQEAAQKKKQQEAALQKQAKIKADQAAKVKQRIAEQKQQAEREVKRKADEQRKAVEAKRKVEQQRKADEARRQRENEEFLQQQMAQEEADRVAQAKAEQQRRELASRMSLYSAQLQNIVNGNWIRPATARTGLKCTVRVRLIPGGEVVEAHVTRSSGDAAFDRSAETAVLRSSPLPAPPDPSLREFDFVFKPEG